MLFMDVVGFTRETMSRQDEIVRDLQEAVRRTPEYEEAQNGDGFIAWPTGDGMAPSAAPGVLPNRCGTTHSSLCEWEFTLDRFIGNADINANRNLVGGGVNVAQRVMDIGDDRHLLLSRNAADIAAEAIPEFRTREYILQDLREVKVKHGILLQMFNA